MSSSLRSSLDAGALTLTLDRPAHGNALSSALVEALHEALERAELDADVRVVVVRGAGDDFCRGTDPDELAASAAQTLADTERAVLRVGTLLQRCTELPKPIIGVVQGRALGVGAALAVACDITVAVDGAILGFPAVRRGAVPAMAMAVRHAIGEKRLLELLLTGRLLDAQAALDAGLVTRVEPTASVETYCAETVAELSVLSPSALALTKRLFYQTAGRSQAQVLALVARVDAMARQTPAFTTSLSTIMRG